ncbi:tryptophan--tRNA ligase [Candidatus Saccharibacteria bacterium]|nr:tryptophan--tRNA ligase [Candidatus Saccharibacteria bacterium]
MEGKTILTGIRVNSEMTLGNFLGALLPMTRLANKYSAKNKVNIFIPDLHTIISDVDGELQKNLVKEIKYYLAAGLELNKNIHIYRQSYVPAHSELCWILNCVATMGETSRMIQYKEKSHNGDSGTNVGIFDYPILMAADILLYGAEYVPVGEDQFQHIELTRNIAERFNNKFGEVFVLPVKTAEQVKFMEMVDSDSSNNTSEGKAMGIRIRDLQNPEKKMSKSAEAENSKIMMNDEPARVTKKIMSAQTDSLGKISFDMFNQPGISNLLQIEALVSGVPLQEVISTWSGETHYGDLKKKVAETVSTYLTDFQKRVSEIPDSKVYEILEEGEKYANEVANKKLLEVQKAVKLR